MYFKCLKPPPNQYDYRLNVRSVGLTAGFVFQVQLEVDARFVQDQLRGDKVTEIRVKLIRRIKEVFAGED